LQTSGWIATSVTVQGDLNSSADGAFICKNPEFSINIIERDMKKERRDREADRGKREREGDWYEWAYGPGGQTACQGVYSGLIVCLNFFRRGSRE
jgi:hypothetical protein